MTPRRRSCRHCPARRRAPGAGRCAGAEALSGGGTAPGPPPLWKLGLPAELEDERGRRVADGHRPIKAIEKAGWSLTRRGCGPWTRVCRPVDGGLRMCVQLGITPWGALGKESQWSLPDDRAAPEIARTLAIYA
ncbi:hypothetical protein ACFWWA_23850 [Streptomyces goshikiensis]|uniref:hypothetical protein n=1 Tax=Streptomyces goshikiensis TaxID=1942 RepID=UPI003647CE55